MGFDMSQTIKLSKWSAGLFAVLLLLPMTAAQAEPYIAVREGYKCSQCHVNKTGGGKRNDFANTYVQTRLASSFVQWQRTDTVDEHEGVHAVSDVYHGRLNPFFSVGADIRMLYTQVETPGVDKKSKTMDISSGLMYFEMEMAPSKASIYIDQSVSSNSTREMFLLFDNMWGDSYLKLGKFFMASGFRLQDDTAYVRAAPTFGYGNPATGVELGIEPGPFSFNVWRINTSEWLTRRGGMAQVLGRRGRFGISYSVDDTTADVRKVVSNAFGGLHFGRFTFLAEVDNIRMETLHSATKNDTAMKNLTTDLKNATKPMSRAWLGEVNLMLSKGSNLKFTFESYDEDTATKGNIVDRNSIIWEPFFTQFLQMRLGLRQNTGQTNNAAENQKTVFLEFHGIFY